MQLALGLMTVFCECYQDRPDVWRGQQCDAAAAVKASCCLIGVVFYSALPCCRALYDLCDPSATVYVLPRSGTCCLVPLTLICWPWCGVMRVIALTLSTVVVGLCGMSAAPAFLGCCNSRPRVSTFEYRPQRVHVTLGQLRRGCGAAHRGFFDLKL